MDQLQTFAFEKHQGLSLDTGLLSKVYRFFQAESISLIFAPDKKVLSEDEKKTQEYDALAFRLVSYGAIPLLAGYTIYSRQCFP